MTTFTIHFKEKNQQRIQLFLEFVKSLDFVQSIEPETVSPPSPSQPKEPDSDLQYQTLQQIKDLYTDEWVLLANPQFREADIAGGIVLFHDKDKSKLFQNAKELVKKYPNATHIYTGEFPKRSKIGLIKMLNNG